jgi:4-hydroxy-2-oxoheptanedioate aldolase
MIPHLMSLEEAEEIVHTVRFHPIGLRPVDSGNADGMYGLLGFKDYIKFMNENRMVIVQIEDPEPLSQLDKICQLPGIDMIFFGPSDFSQAIGHPAEFDHPEVHRVRKLVVETAHKYGKFAGTVSLPSLAQCYEEGFDFVNCGADVSAISANCKAVMEQYAGCTGK